MVKIAKVLSILFIALIAMTVFGSAGTLDDLERSRKDMERSIKYGNLKDSQYQKKYQLPQQKIQTFRNDVVPKDRPATDRAITKNQERFEKMMNEQKKSSAKIQDNWGFVIPKEYRLTVELFAIALFLIFFSLLFYRQSIRRREEEKKEESLKKDQSLYEDE